MTGSFPSCRSPRLVFPENAAALDREASASWGLNPFALVEAAGRACASALILHTESEARRDTRRWRVMRETSRSDAFISKDHLPRISILVCAGPGNNGADALVMLRSLLMTEFFLRGAAGNVMAGTLPDTVIDTAAGVVSRGAAGTATLPAVLISRAPATDENSPRSEAVKALKAMGVPVITWDGEEKAASLFQNAALIIDGVAGTGIKGALEGIPLEMAAAINNRRKAIARNAAACDIAAQDRRCRVVSVDVPSGACGAWKPGMPIVTADYTLAIEPLKTVLYTPALRPHCGAIIPVENIFPLQLLERYGDAELLRWEEQRAQIPSVPADAYKYVRGTVEIHAGSPGFAGAARLAAAGTSAAGAGLTRLVVDDQLYPVLAASSGGVMVVPAGINNFSSHEDAEAQRAARQDAAQTSCFGQDGFKDDKPMKPDALLLGPGWGRGGERRATLERALEAERSGIPLVLDADGIALLKTLYPEAAAGNGPEIFHGRAILTPHAGELAALSGIPGEKLLSEPALIAELAKKLNAVILFKSHVMIAAAPDGRLGFIDGMDPSLGAGGSGDFLAGLCAAIAGRMRAAETRGTGIFDPYAAAAAAGTLLTAASRRMGRRFYDPLELARPAAALAGQAWLPPDSQAARLPAKNRKGHR